MPPTPKGYSPVDSDSEKGEHDSFLDAALSETIDSSLSSRPRWLSQQRVMTLLPWCLTVIFATLYLALLVKRDAAASFGSYENGFYTDIITPSQVPLEEVRFRGSPHFDINGTGFLDPVDIEARWPENMLLFGPPSDEIDDNWDRLIGKRYFSISEEEAQRAWGAKRSEYVDERVGGYTAGLEVFHTLHCVNALRKALHPDYYPMKSHHHGPFHLEHCLNALRQTIQCYGSTTLIPTKFREGLEHNYIDSEQPHVCRSFSFLRDFVTSRAKGHEAYEERDKSLVDQRKHAIATAWKGGHKKHH